MANPKKRTSKSKRDSRRSHDALSVVSVNTCPQCRDPKLPHRICPHCGYYNNRKVVDIDAGI